MQGSQKKLHTGRGAGVGVGLCLPSFPNPTGNPPRVILPLRTEHEAEGLCKDSCTT